MIGSLDHLPAGKKGIPMNPKRREKGTQPYSIKNGEVRERAKTELEDRREKKGNENANPSLNLNLEMRKDLCTSPKWG